MLQVIRFDCAAEAEQHFKLGFVLFWKVEDEVASITFLEILSEVSPVDGLFQNSTQITGVSLRLGVDSVADSAFPSLSSILVTGRSRALRHSRQGRDPR